MIRKFVVQGAPVPKARPRITRQGRAYTPKRTQEYEERVKTSYIEKYGHIAVSEMQPLAVEMRFYVPIPKSWSKKKHKMAVVGKIKPTTRPDIDNYIKAILDSLNNGIAYVDDSCVCDINASKRYSEKPRTVISITEIEDESKEEEATSESQEESRTEAMARYDCQSH